MYGQQCMRGKAKVAILRQGNPVVEPHSFRSGNESKVLEIFASYRTILAGPALAW
jgi:hypothetical protein